MKNTLFSLLLALIALQATAQTTVTEKDSSYLELINGVYFETREVIYPSGDYAKSGRLVGSATDVVNYKVSDFAQRVDQMAEVARPVSFHRARITEIIREAAAVKTLLGSSPLDTIQARLVAPLLVSGWTMKNGVGSTTIVFSVSGAGQLRYKLGTDVLKNAVLLGSVIRLKNYSTTTEDMDLYLRMDGSYFDILRKYTLKKP